MPSDCGHSGCLDAFLADHSLIFELAILLWRLVSILLVRGRFSLDNEGERTVISIFTIIILPYATCHCQALKLSYGFSLSQGKFPSLLELWLADEWSNHTDFVVVVWREVEPESLCRPQLHEVVIERLLGDFDLIGGFLQGQLDCDAVFLVPRVQKAPETDRWDDISDCALLDSGPPATHVYAFSRNSLTVLQTL